MTVKRDSISGIYGCHEAVFLDYRTKAPLAISRLVSSIAINQTGDLVAREGGSYRFPLAHYEGRNALEVQLTLKSWEPGFYRIAAGAETSDIDNIATELSVQIETLLGKAAADTFTIEVDDDSTPVFGYHRLIADASDWGVELVGSPSDPATTGDYVLGTLAQSSVTAGGGTVEIPKTGLKLGTKSGYMVTEGDGALIRIFPENEDALIAHSTSVKDSGRRPYVSAVFSAENSEGRNFTVYIPKLKCSSGLPITMTEKTDNEYQLTFMASQPTETGEDVYRINQVA